MTPKSIQVFFLKRYKNIPTCRANLWDTDFLTALLDSGEYSQPSGIVASPPTLHVSFQEEEEEGENLFT